MKRASFLATQALRAVKKGVLDRDQYTLTPKQRERYNQFRQAGIDEKTARQLAVMVTKSAPDMTPPKGVREAARRGLEQMGEHGGDGLTDGAKSRARAMAAGKPVSERTARHMASFHARHGAQAGPMTDDDGGPTPKAVATNLWGGKPGAAWAKKLSAALDAVNKGSKPLGAAFARARAKQKDKGGSLKDHANDYLREKGHKPIGKALATQAMQKSYANQFVASARDALPRTYFNQLHDKARAKAGGTASGMARRALSDEAKASLMQRRKALKDELSQVEAELQKTAPLAQEISVDAPVVLKPKEKKKRKKLAEDVVAEALQAVKSSTREERRRVNVQVRGRLLKSAAPEWKRIVHSVVYAPGDVDAHGDYMDAEDIEKMAHDAMRTGLYVNHEHEDGAIEADIVESYIAPQDLEMHLPGGEPYTIPKGSHVMAMHVWGDEPWAKIQSGEYVGYSLEGTALRDAA